MNFSLEKFFRAVKSDLKKEALTYYNSIFSRKSGPPVCIALCVLMIVSFAISHI